MTASPTAVRTRFAPAPTGYLHLGHVANAIWVWGMAGRPGREVLLRIEDHDRVRCRPEFDAALLEDLAWLGFAADEGPVRQSDDDAPYAAALAGSAMRSRVRLRLLADDIREVGRRARPALARPGLPGRLSRARSRRTGAAGRARWRIRGAGWTSSSDRARTRSRPTATSPVRDRDGQLDVRVLGRRRRPAPGRRPRRPRPRPAGRDRRSRSGSDVCSGARLPATFAHHRLVRDADGRKLSKADGATGVRELRAAGMRPRGGHRPRAAAAAAADRLLGPWTRRVRRMTVDSRRVPGDEDLARVAPVLHLPGVVEGVPGDPARRVTSRPLATGERLSRRTARAGRRASRFA